MTGAFFSSVSFSFFFLLDSRSGGSDAVSVFPNTGGWLLMLTRLYTTIIVSDLYIRAVTRGCRDVGLLAVPRIFERECTHRSVDCIISKLF